MKILVVEDEQKIANSIKRGLELENHVVDIASDGEAGYDMAHDGKYDVVVLDLMLPKINGNDVCTSLRKDGIQVPILMLTAKGELLDKIKGFTDGADDYLVKPFAFEELLARIKALAKRKKDVISQHWTVNGIYINTDTYEVKKDGKAVNLSKKEFLILEYLMRNSGKVVSKDNIISYVWNYENDVLPNTVEVFIGYLRDKIGKNNIKTVRGFGYKFE